MLKISGNIVDVLNRRIFKGEISVENGVISAILPMETCEPQYILPGLIDAHIHIESSMLVPTEFARIAAVHGTTATVSDPHEIANVLGIPGIKFMIDNGDFVPFKFNFGAPSCVPATQFETSGAVLDSTSISELLSDPKILYLSEMMNYPGVIYDVPFVMEKLKIAQDLNKPIDGHAPGLRGDDLKKYVNSGISTDHECFSLEEAKEKISLGMKILIREGSAAKNFDALHSLIHSDNSMVMLCSDDLHPNDLLKGHINLIIKKALSLGYDLIDILTTCTVNPVTHYGLNSGLLQSGDDADFVIIDSPEDFNIQKTYIKGELVAEDGKSLIISVPVKPINNFNISSLNVESLKVPFVGGKTKVIGIIPGEIITESNEYQLNVDNGYLFPDLERDILKLAVINRYSDATPAVAFVKGFGIKKGAVATSVAHDSHNIICIGVDDHSMQTAINELTKNKGGMVVFDGLQIFSLPLPVAGLMSINTCSEVSQKYEELEKKAQLLGSQLYAPFMTLSFLSLIVIPKLKLSDKGLFDVEKFEFTSLNSI
jgi:adenine deaminase